MSTAQATSNKAIFRRFHDATNAHDDELISETIDEIVDPDVKIRTPLPVQATGAQALEEVFARLHRAFPDLHVTVEDLIEEGDKVVGRNTITRIYRRGCWTPGRSLARLRPAVRPPSARDLRCRPTSRVKEAM
jgi:predicted ester cyclase